MESHCAGERALRDHPERNYIGGIRGKVYKGTLMGTSGREPQEYNRNIIEHKDPGRYIPIIFLLYSWGSLFGVPIKVPLV